MCNRKTVTTVAATISTLLFLLLLQFLFFIHFFFFTFLSLSVCFPLRFLQSMFSVFSSFFSMLAIFSLAFRVQCTCDKKETFTVMLCVDRVVKSTITLKKFTYAFVHVIKQHIAVPQPLHKTKQFHQCGYIL